MTNDGIHSCYLDRCFRPEEVRRTVRMLAKRLKKHAHAFDAIACQGWSGALIAPILALRLGKPLIMVRKQGENGHSSYLVEGYLKTESYVIVDDFVASGRTICRIIETIQDTQTRLFETGTYGVTRPLATCYGTALYSESGAAGACNIFPFSPRIWTLRDEWAREKIETPPVEVLPPEVPVTVNKTKVYLPAKAYEPLALTGEEAKAAWKASLV